MPLLAWIRCRNCGRWWHSAENCPEHCAVPGCPGWTAHCEACGEYLGDRTFDPPCPRCLVGSARGGTMEVL